MELIKIIVSGIRGRMGHAVLEAVRERSDEFCVVAGIDVEKTVINDIPVYAAFADVREDADVVIDFSRPEALRNMLPFCAERNVAVVVGTTGLSQEDRDYIDSFVPRVAIFASGNMSLGVNLQIQLIKKAAATLGDNFEVEIVEKHHHQKVDAPSGTALMLGNAVAAQFPKGRRFMFGRYTKTERRRPDEIGFHSIRGGTIVGEHEVMFIGTDEIVEINHRAYSKQIFVQGALRGAIYLMGKQPGLYNMQDIVLENDVASHLYATDEQSLINVRNLSGKALRDVFEAVAKQRILVDMISMARPCEVSFTVPERRMYAAIDAVNALKSEYPAIECDGMDGITKITAEGAGMEFNSGVAADLFSVLVAQGIEVFIVSTSETKIAYGIDARQAQQAIRALSDYMD